MLKTRYLFASGFTVEVAGVDIESVYCSRRPQFNDYPVMTDVRFSGDWLSKPLPVRVRVMSTGFPSVIQSAIGTKLPFEAFCRLQREREIRESRRTGDNTVATFVSKRWKASAKNSSDKERIKAPREALESSERNKRHIE